MDRLATVGLVWLGMVSLDFLLQGGLLAPLYDWRSPFLLDPHAALLRIPIGYLGLAVQAATLVWLLARIGIRGSLAGMVTGCAIGAGLGGGLVLGLASISTAPASLLGAWWVAGIAESGLGGWIAVKRMEGQPLRSLLPRVIALLIVSVATTVILQSVGYASVSYGPGGGNRRLEPSRAEVRGPYRDVRGLGALGREA